MAGAVGRKRKENKKRKKTKKSHERGRYKEIPVLKSRFSTGRFGRRI